MADTISGAPIITVEPQFLLTPQTRTDNFLVTVTDTNDNFTFIRIDVDDSSSYNVNYNVLDRLRPAEAIDPRPYTRMNEVFYCLLFSIRNLGFTFLSFYNLRIF